MAVLLEGKFHSLFDNRVPKSLIDDSIIRFKKESRDTKMIVVGDGDIIKNQVYRNADGTYSALPLGYDKYTKQNFGNRDFILNAMNYLIDETGLISIRSRNVKLRMLNSEKVQHERTYWQILNVVLPLIILFLFAFAMVFQRKFRYSKKKER
jgi:ABC-2 type transport system permease protein